MRSRKDPVVIDSRSKLAGKVTPAAAERRPSLNTTSSAWRCRSRNIVRPRCELRGCRRQAHGVPCMSIMNIRASELSAPHPQPGLRQAQACYTDAPRCGTADQAHYIEQPRSAGPQVA